jgi:hypothetical protein
MDGPLGPEAVELMESEFALHTELLTWRRLCVRLAAYKNAGCRASP